MEKQIKQIYNGHKEEVVPGTYIQRPLPQAGFKKLGPFILLDHIGPKLQEPNKPMKIPAHPHCGFEPVTIVFEGSLKHRDSIGNVANIDSGDVQWLTSGSGVVHEEGLQDEFAKTGGPIHFVQLWVNLPKAFKKIAPSYNAIKADYIPTLMLSEGATLKLIAGEYQGNIGPARTFSPMMIGNLHLEKGTTVVINLPADFDSGFFIANGKVKISESEIIQEQLVTFELEKEQVSINSLETSDILILSGQPINEPLVTYGPFVLNSFSEIEQAIRDYESGRMGKL